MPQTPPYPTYCLLCPKTTEWHELYCPRHREELEAKGPGWPWVDPTEEPPESNL